jgi:hypothetical protein
VVVGEARYVAEVAPEIGESSVQVPGVLPEYHWKA